MLTADPHADLEGALVDWRQFRRRKRVADVHWIDVVYSAYLTGIVAIVAVVVASSFVGDDPATATEVRTVLADGPGWIGGLAAFALALGLRSGSRGGPLALERAEVRHVLLAPVDRTSALRAPTLRQLRFLAFLGLVVGGIAGYLATQRLPGTEPAWIATGALAGVTLVGLSVGAALLVAATRLPRPVASLLGLLLIAAAVADGTDVLPTSPTAPFGDLVLWPLRFEAIGLLPVVVAIVLLAIGLVLLGHASLEAAERRSSLVGQLRFAATMQDLRTVIVLRRQLAMELPRLRPWVRIPVRGTGRWPVFLRGLRGVLRWPAARVARLVLLGVVGGVALRGTWTGTTPLIVLAGLAMFLAGLDAVEPLAQEVDHPSRRDASPLDASAIHLRHIPVGIVTMVLTAAVAGLAASTPGPGQVPGDVAAVLVVPLALGGLGGALVSVLGGPANISEGWSLAPPEAQGIRLAFRTAWPPGIAVLGATPVLLARRALDDNRSALDGAIPAALAVVALFALVCVWVRVRDDMAAWFKESMSMAHQQQQQRGRTTDGDD
ncbi:MAG: hypothetical protein ABWZ76_10985 [Acidimicrobiales bacterium]